MGGLDTSLDHKISCTKFLITYIIKEGKRLLLVLKKGFIVLKFWFKRFLILKY